MRSSALVKVQKMIVFVVCPDALSSLYLTFQNLGLGLPQQA